MKQLTVMNLFDEMENVEKDIISENVNTSDVKEVITELSGIMEIKNKKGTYKTWKVKFIKPSIIKFLKEKVPDSLIIREFNKVDLTIICNKIIDRIPVEIQKSLINRSSFRHAAFEDSIRRQLEDNIETHGKCWFFMDSEYLRYLQYGNNAKQISVNMTWFLKLINEDKLKVFSIRYDGIVKELKINDFKFLEDINTKDDIIINRNRIEVYNNIRIAYSFTQEEIDDFYIEFDNRGSDENDKEFISSAGFFMNSNNERCKCYGNILGSIKALNGINSMLDMNNDSYQDKLRCVYLGIFEIVGNYASGSTGHNMKFVDKFDICKYFPGYLRQEKHWLTYKGNEMDGKTFSNMCRGFYKNAATIFDY